MYKTRLDATRLGYLAIRHLIHGSLCVCVCVCGGKIPRAQSHPESHPGAPPKPTQTKPDHTETQIRPLSAGPTSAYVKLKIKKKMGVRHPAACGGWTLDFGE